MKRYAMVVAPECPKCKKSKELLTEANLIDEVDLLGVDTHRDEVLLMAQVYKLTTAGIQILDRDSKTIYQVEEFINLAKKVGI